MTDLKITTWNIEHFARILADDSSEMQRRRSAIADEIRQIDPDILCVVEGPGDLTLLQEFVDDPNGLDNRYRIPLIPGTTDLLAPDPANPRAVLADLYKMQGNDTTGNQWIWFLVKDQVFDNATQRLLQNPIVWQEFVGHATWRVNLWGDMSTRTHRHWRHPQVLVLELEGARAEFIGVHLKSKINRRRPFDDDGNLLASYVQEAIKARIKLATEAENVRNYIDARFGQEPAPRIFVLGDANDGPGKRFFERQFLFFDLLSNLQGNVFFARQFLNHCLFDFEEQLRWSTNFRDPIEPSERFQLLDHILFTQSLVGDSQFPHLEAGAGLVEHTIHETISATLPGADTSDHHPVSVTVRWSP
jgi:hypothetical protein